MHEDFLPKAADDRGDGLTVVPSARFLSTPGYRPTIREALESYLRNLPSEASQTTYRKCLKSFMAYMRTSTPAEAVALLVRNGEAAARLIVIDYMRVLRDRGLKSASINSHLTALRFAVRVVKACDVIPWTLDVKSLKTRAYRDMRGPDLPGIRALLAAAGAGFGIRALRDPALLRVLFTMGLRRAEVSGLNVCHYDSSERTFQIASKGSAGERTFVTVPPATATALNRYLDARGQPEDGPLFLNVDKSRKGRSDRLTGAGIYYVVRRLAGEAKLRRPTSPHRLRHSAVTSALDRTHGDVRRVQGFSRHAKLETLTLYDDARRNDAGGVAALLDAAVDEPEVEGITNAQVPNLANENPAPVEASRWPAEAPAGRDR